MVAEAVLLGLAVRLALDLSSSFPLNDGGLTRSVGGLFAIIALHQSRLMDTPPIGYTRVQHWPTPRAFSTPFSTFSDGVFGN